MTVDGLNIQISKVERTAVSHAFTLMLLFLLLLPFHIYLCVCAPHDAQTTVHMWGPKDNLWKWLLPFHHVGCMDGTWNSGHHTWQRMPFLDIFPALFFFFLLFLRYGFVEPRLILDLLCSWGWSWISDPLGSTSQDLGFQACASTLPKCLDFFTFCSACDSLNTHACADFILLYSSHHFPILIM